jgi:hypothetical protein
LVARVLKISILGLTHSFEPMKLEFNLGPFGLSNSIHLQKMAMLGNTILVIIIIRSNLKDTLGLFELFFGHFMEES